MLQNRCETQTQCGPSDLQLHTEFISPLLELRIVHGPVDSQFPLMSYTLDAKGL